MTEELTNVIERAKQLCEWIGQNPHQRGSINGLAAQVQHELSALTQRPAAQEVDDLPGMWDHSDLSGGETDAKPEWRDLFWALARELKCLPSTDPGANQHVFRAARARASLPAPQQATPALTDSMGMPTSCGKPLCSPDEHHPLCSLHKPAAQDTQQATPEPVPMVLHCPKCGMQHIDAPEEHWNREFLYSWENPPHRSHLCHGCGTIWRPADVPTTGVKSISTKGKADTWEPGQAATPEPVGEPTREMVIAGRRAVQATQGCSSAGVARSVFEAMSNARPAPGVPDGWRIFRTHDGIDVHTPDGGACYVEAKATADRRIPEEVLHALCCDLLAAAQAKGAKHE